MEVHHHPHADPPNSWTHRKKFTHYVWEFLMLFLAVFCGFLAENFREQSVERHRETQFIRSYLEDLKSDTAAISRVLVFRYQKMQRMDSLMLLLSSQSADGQENELYYLGRTLIRTIWFRSNDRTITQLKNSGALRLIRNEQAADSMMSYQELVETINTNQEDDRNERSAAGPILSRMFDSFVFDKMVTATGINKPDNHPPLRSFEQNTRQDLAYYVHQLKAAILSLKTVWNCYMKKQKILSYF